MPLSIQVQADTTRAIGGHEVSFAVVAEGQAGYPQCLKCTCCPDLGNYILPQMYVFSGALLKLEWNVRIKWNL